MSSGELSSNETLEFERVPVPTPEESLTHLQIELLKEMNSIEGKRKIHESILKRLCSDIIDWDLKEDSNNPTNPQITILNTFMGESGLSNQIGLWCKISINFSTWVKIQSKSNDWLANENHDDKQPNFEIEREDMRKLIVKVFDTAMVGAWEIFKIRLIFSEINLSRTEGSMRTIFNGAHPLGIRIQRQTEIEILNLSFTKSSGRSLTSLYKLTNIRELILDYCPYIKNKDNQLFHELLKRPSILNLETLSIVGNPYLIYKNWVEMFQKKVLI